MAEKVRLRIGSIAKAVLVTGQAYQDPKDALNEFVSNAADEYAECGGEGERIQLVLRRRGRYPTIAIDDSGRGMSPDRLRELARNLFNSVKAGDDRTLGEKAIGLLAFQQLGARADIVSRAASSNETWCLGLERGSATASLDRERRRARATAGTTIFLRDLDREVLRMLTQRKMIDYLRIRRGAAIERGDYVLEVVEGKHAVVVTAVEPDGVRVALRKEQTLWGPIEFGLYVTEPGADGLVAVVGRAGTTIIDDITELEEFDHPPWDTGQVSGRVVFDGLQQSAGRRSILRDDDAFPVFTHAVLGVEQRVRELAEKVRAEVDEDTTSRVSEEIRKLFAAVLREMEDLANPMYSATGGERGDGEPGSVPSPDDPNSNAGSSGAPTLGDMTRSSAATNSGGETPPRGTNSTGAGRRSSRLPSVAPDPAPGNTRSRFNEDEQVVLYNENHRDYLMAKGSETALVDYLAMLVAKEYVVFNNPRAAPDDLAEEMVRMTLHVRKVSQRRRAR